MLSRFFHIQRKVLSYTILLTCYRKGNVRVCACTGESKEDQTPLLLILKICFFFSFNNLILNSDILWNLTKSEILQCFSRELMSGFNISLLFERVDSGLVGVKRKFVSSFVLSGRNHFAFHLSYLPCFLFTFSLFSLYFNCYTNRMLDTSHRGHLLKVGQFIILWWLLLNKNLSTCWWSIFSA